MGVYVDAMLPTQRTGRWPYSSSCHLMADSLGELHAMAAGIGLRREWFQDGTLPHYDLTRSKRRLAIRAGASELTRVQVVERINMYRKRMKAPNPAPAADGETT